MHEIDIKCIFPSLVEVIFSNLDLCLLQEKNKFCYNRNYVG